MTLKTLSLAAALAAPIALALTIAVPATAKTERPATVTPTPYLIALDAPLGAADTGFRRSLHIEQTASYRQGDRHYIAVTAPSESVLRSFLKGIGHTGEDVIALPTRWTGSGYAALPASAATGHLAIAD